MTSATRFAAGCAGKERHVSEAAAVAVGRMGRAALEPYRCGFCDGWHLASTPGHRTRSRDTGRGAAFEKMRHHPSPSRPSLPRPPPAPTPIVTCPRGPTFPSEIEAIRSARGLTDVRLRAFLCPCGGWHLIARRGRR